MAFPFFVGAGPLFASVSAGSAVWPAAHQALDVGILLTELGNNFSPPPTGWTEFPSSPRIADTGSGATTTILQAFWRRAASGAEPDAAIPDTGNHQIGQIITFRGCIETGNPFDIEGGDVNLAATTAVAVPGGVTTVPECLILAICAAGLQGVSTPQFSGWANADLANVTEILDSFAASGNGGGFGVATGEKAVAGAFGATTATLAAAFSQARLMVALRPPAAAPGVPPIRSHIVVAPGAVHRASRW